jgi:hypothetical protein
MIDTARLEFINNRADVVLGSRSTDLQPSVCWGMGCHARADGRRITVWLSRAQAATVIADIQANGAVAVTFVEPLTSRSLQLKGRDARVRDAQPQDAEILERHLDNMVREVALLGFSEMLARAAFGLPLHALVAVEFTPDDVFEQTPGPNAGKSLKAAA